LGTSETDEAFGGGVGIRMAQTANFIKISGQENKPRKLGNAAASSEICVPSDFICVINELPRLLTTTK